MAGISVKKVREKMENLGVFKEEFAPTIERYVKLSKEYSRLYKEYERDEYPCCTTSGNSGARKSPTVMVLETLRKDLLQLEESLGLTPRGLMKIQENAFKRAKDSAKKDRLI